MIFRRFLLTDLLENMENRRFFHESQPTFSESMNNLGFWATEDLFTLPSYGLSERFTVVWNVILAELSERRYVEFSFVA